MEAIELYNKDGKSVGIFYCKECKLVHNNKESADSCCVCEMCKTNKREKHKIYCKECLKIHESERDEKEKQALKKKLENATLVDKWDYLWFNEKLYGDPDEIIEMCTEDGLPIPEYVHPAKPIKFQGFSLLDILDRIAEDAFLEDMTGQDIAASLKDYASLDVAIKLFNEANKDTTIYYEEDWSKKVKVGN